MENDNRRHSQEAGDLANPVEKGPPSRCLKGDVGNSHRNESLSALWKMINADKETTEFPKLEAGVDQS